MLSNVNIDNIDKLIRRMALEKDEWVSLAIAIDLADEIMGGILPQNPEWQRQLNRDVQKTGALPKPLPIDVFKNQKQITWFREHPESGSARIALQLFESDDCVLESTFYWFSENSTKQKISATTGLTTNWEDSELTRKPGNKVGIDFILTKKADTLLIVLTDRQKHRVMELHDHLSNTQKQIFINDLGSVSDYFDRASQDLTKIVSQKAIHESLWNAFQLKEVNRKFYEIIASYFDRLVETMEVQNNKNNENAKQFSSRLLGRLLFIWFLRKMNVINEEIGYFDTSGKTSTSYYNDTLKMLFFNTLNKPVEERMHRDKKTPFLNGGLFEAKENDYFFEELIFPDRYFEELFERFNEFNFTTDESTADFELIAVDPEMLGQVFESLLASQNSEEGNNERNKTGSFYTPREVVNFMCKESLRSYLYAKLDNSQLNPGIDQLIDLSDSKFLERKSTSQAELWGINSKSTINKVKQALDDIKVLDPACGSGAFPMGMMQLLLRTYERVEPRYDPYKLKLSIIENSIFGVDIQPMAVEISRLRAWLSVIVDDQDKQNVHPLPNLDFKFISANTLVELEDREDNVFSNPELDLELISLREKYFNARNPQRKKKIQQDYYNVIKQGPFSNYEDKRSGQLRTFDPFINQRAATFFDSKYMFGVDKGFDVIIGNPPYIHLEHMGKDDRSFYKSLKYDVFAARGDMYSLFYEKGVHLLRNEGVLAFITSNKWMRAGYGKALRNFFVKETNPLLLIDLGSGVFDSATVDTNILILEKSKNEHKLRAVTANKDSMDNMSVFVAQHSVENDFKLDEPWTILSEIEQSIKRKIEAVGTPLKDWNISINYGIKTGLNEAFIISKEKRDELIAQDPKSAEIIRPILRGRNIRKNKIEFSNEYLIMLFPAKKYNIDDFPAIKRWLIDGDWVLRKTKKNNPTPIGSGCLRLRQAGEQDEYQGTRFYTRKKTSNRWFETQDSIGYWDDFSKPKIVFSRISTGNPCFAMDLTGFLLNDTGYIITGDQLDYILTQLTSKLIWFAFQRFYMGGGINKEFKVNNLLSLPIPDVGNEVSLSEEELELIENSIP